jgi:hypothetical protein
MGLVLRLTSRKLLSMALVVRVAECHAGSSQRKAWSRFWMLQISLFLIFLEGLEVI